MTVRGVTAMKNRQTDPSPLVEQYQAVRGRLPGQDVTWLHDLRENGIDRFRSLGLPGPKAEAWKYTRLPDLSEEGLRPVSWQDGQVAVEDIRGLMDGVGDHPILVFANGFLRPELSRLDRLPEGVSIEPLVSVLERDPGRVEGLLTEQVGKSAERAFPALNAAMMESGVFVHAKEGTRLEHPIELLHLNGFTDTPVMRNPRNIFLIEENCEITLVAQHRGLAVGAYFTNAVTDIRVGQGSRLRHYTVQDESRDAVHLVSVNARVAADATYETFALSIGGRLSRAETSVRLMGRGANCSLSGAYLMRGREHCDTTTLVEHEVPDTTSSEVFKGVLDDESRGVFAGRIVVHKDAQRTDGHMLSKAILLSDKAEMDAKPELEIYADDVKCSHGATTGHIDEGALFYLRSRGVPETLARNLLIQSFITEALDEIADRAVRDAMADRVLHWLPAHCYLAEEWRGE